MSDKFGPKEQQVRELRERRDASKKRNSPSPAELRSQIAKIQPKPAKTPNKHKGK